MLQEPVWPLFQTVVLLALAGEYTPASGIISELPDPVELPAYNCANPAEKLRPYLDLLDRLARVLVTGRPDAGMEPFTITGNGRNLGLTEAVTEHTRQKVLERELEAVNSLLCKPWSCHICCTGPQENARHRFFEIPLGPDEIDLFAVPAVDSADTRSSSPYDTDDLHINGRPFYEAGPAIFHWAGGWSLILPRGTECPNLMAGQGCISYARRPETCKKPQIFAYVINMRNNETKTGTFDLAESLLAVTDCPYVNALREKILDYAQANGLRLVLRANKA